MAKSLYRSWGEIPFEEKEEMVNEFLLLLQEKLLDKNTKEVNISLNKGVSKMYIGKLLVDQHFDGRETYTLKINHNGDL